MQLGNFIGSAPINQGPLLLENTLKILLKGRKFGYPIIFIQNMGGKGDPDERTLRQDAEVSQDHAAAT